MAETMAPEAKTDEEKVEASLAGLSKDELKAKIQSGELNHIILDPEKRRKLLSGELTAPQPKEEKAEEEKLEEKKPDPEKTPDKEVKPAESEPKAPDESKPGESEPEKKGEEETEPEKSSKDDWGGYNSKEELIEHVGNLKQLTESQQSKIDGFNSERGKLGTKMQIQEKELEKLKVQFKTAVDNPVDPVKEKVDVSALVFPKPPVAKDGDYLNDDYLKERAEYDIKVADVHGKLAQAYQSMGTKNAALEETLGKLSTYVEEGRVETKKTTLKQVETDLFDDVHKLQGLHKDLKSERSFKEMDDIVSKQGWDDAKKYLTPNDAIVYRKLFAIVNEYGTFDETGSFHKKQKNLGRAHLVYLDETGQLDNDKKEEIAKVNKAAGDALQTKTNEKGSTATTIPNSKSAPKESMNEMGADNAMKEFKILQAEYHKNTRAFVKSEAFARWKDLATKFGVPIPKSQPLT